MLTEMDVRLAIASAVDRVPVEDLGLEEGFYAYGLDSLEHAQILMRVEEIHGLRVADADFDLCISIATILEYSGRETPP
jgi:acyl carrier protein